MNFHPQNVHSNKKKLAYKNGNHKNQKKMTSQNLKNILINKVTPNKVKPILNKLSLNNCFKMNHHNIFK